MEEANEKERYWINALDTLKPNGYNVSDGGNYGNPFAGKTEEEMKAYRLEQSRIHKERWKNDPLIKKQLDDALAIVWAKNRIKKEKKRGEIEKRKEDSKLRVDMKKERMWFLRWVINSSPEYQSWLKDRRREAGEKGKLAMQDAEVRKRYDDAMKNPDLILKRIAGGRKGGMLRRNVKPRGNYPPLL